MKTKTVFPGRIFDRVLLRLRRPQTARTPAEQGTGPALFRGMGQSWRCCGSDALIATNVVLRNPPAVVHGFTEYKQGMAAFHSAFPDLHFTIEDEIADENKIAVRWTFRAKHLGEYHGRPPTGKAVTMTGISIFQIANGKIQDITVNMDRLGQFQQLGWLPEFAPPAK